MIIKKTIMVEKKRVVTPSQKRQIDTGVKKEITIISEDGTRRVDLVPIYREEIDPPIVEAFIDAVEIWVVEDKRSGEEHVFHSEKDAINFSASSSVGQ